MELIIAGVCPYCRRKVAFQQGSCCEKDYDEQRAFELISARTPKLVQQPSQNPYESFVKIMDDAASERLNAVGRIRDYFRSLELQANRTDGRKEISSLQRKVAKMSVRISSPVGKEFEAGKKRVLAILKKKQGGKSEGRKGKKQVH